MKWLVFITLGTYLYLVPAIGFCQTTPEADSFALPPLPVPSFSSEHLEHLEHLPSAAYTHNPSQYADIIHFLQSPDLITPPPPTSAATTPDPPSRAHLYLFLQRFLTLGNTSNSTAISAPIAPSSPSSDTIDALLLLDTPGGVPTSSSPPPATTEMAAKSTSTPFPTNPPPLSIEDTMVSPVSAPVPDDSTSTTLPAAVTADAQPSDTPNTPDASAVGAQPSDTPNTSDASATTTPPPSPTVTTPGLPLPPTLPTAPVAPLLKKADLAYLRKLDIERKALSSDKTLSHSTDTLLSEVEKQMLKTRTLQEFSDDISIQRDAIPKDTSRTNNTSTSRITPTISVHDTPKQPSKTLKKNIELNRASNALISGQISAAISLYKALLEEDSENSQALFGLATAYQRDRQDTEAYALYTKLLKREPENKEALNNFLLLAANEAPEDALLKLKRLERINPEFSPILAQIGMIYLKMDKTTEAEHYLRHALVLSPDNPAYIYNLAVTLDHEGKYPEALALYKQLLEAGKKGQDIPGSFVQIQKRATYLSQK